MKRLPYTLAIIGACIVFWGGILAPETVLGDPDAKKTAPNLSGTMSLQYNAAWVNSPTTIPVWVGTITFEGGAGTYNMRFFHLNPPRDVPAQAAPFVERFEIYDGSGTVVLGGSDEGVTTWTNNAYRMNGVITTVSSTFELWKGHKVHMSGDIIWSGDELSEAPGTFRAN